jgi:hypothetical protein
MIPVHSTAIRAWVEPDKLDNLEDLDKAQKKRTTEVGPPWRPTHFGKRVLVFDTETTTDYSQRLLFGFYRLYIDAKLKDERLIVADDLTDVPLKIATDFASAEKLEVVNRTEFVEDVFYPEVYRRGALCVGFNLPFDLARIAVRAGSGTGRNRRKFSLLLTRRARWPRIRIESISGRAAFIGFAPKKKENLAKWELPFFSGRFLDLSTLVVAFLGEPLSLRTAGNRFKANVLKSETPLLGKVTPESLAYGRRDVEATWSIYERLLEEYQAHPFASLENERATPQSTLPITKIYSTASVAKQYLRLMGFMPLLKKQPRFSRTQLGHGAASYYGGRAEVHVRKTDVPVTVLDFTSMYPTVFILQDLQRLIGARNIKVRSATRRTRDLLSRLTLEDLFDPKTWPLLTRLVRMRPDGDILPVRFKLRPDEDGAQPAPFSISVTHFTSGTDRWYTLADVFASSVLSGKAPRILEAIEFYSNGAQSTQSVMMRKAILVDPALQVFKKVVEERQVAKRENREGGDLSLGRIDLALKGFANSGAYGINFEVNVTPPPARSSVSGMVYSDETYPSADVGAERPGAFCNPIVASLVTGAARLILAMLESEVSSRGGTFAFCDTDSLAIVAGANCPPEIPHLERTAIAEIIDKFDRLNPYDRNLVPHMLKDEYPDKPDLRCFAISAKRYALYRIPPGVDIEIVKASESGLGGIIGRTEKENTAELARAVWLEILSVELRDKYNLSESSRSECRDKFEIPVRRKLPLSQPRILRNKGFRKFNKQRKYSAQIKPFGFIQALVPAYSAKDVQPIAPFESDARRSRDLPWVDLHTGAEIVVDWTGAGHAGTVPAMTLAEYIERYRNHPEAKAADQHGNPSSPSTKGVLHRLQIVGDAPVRIGKEVDRLEEDFGTDLMDGGPEAYNRVDGSIPKYAVRLKHALDALANFRPKRGLSEELGVSLRRLRDVLKGRSRPRASLQVAIIQFAYNLESLKAHTSGD